MAETYKIKNGYELVEFTGRSLGWATTERADTVRWTEVELYRTEGGQYVIHTLGRSVVYHAVDAECNAGKEVPTNELTEDSEPCEKCRPDPKLTSRIAVERERSSAVVVADAADVQEAMKIRRKPDNELFLSTVSLRALDEAIENDEELAAAIVQRRTVA